MLTPRQAKVLEMLLQGHTHAQVRKALNFNRAPGAMFITKHYYLMILAKTLRRVKFYETYYDTDRAYIHDVVNATFMPNRDPSDAGALLRSAHPAADNAPTADPKSEN